MPSNLAKKLKWKEKEEGVCLLSKYLFSKYCGSGLHMRKGCGSHTVAVLDGKSGHQRAICTAQSPMHNILHKNSGKGGTNKSEWCKRSWRVSNWAIWKHPIILLLKYQKSLFKGEEKVLGVKLWTTFVRNLKFKFEDSITLFCREFKYWGIYALFVLIFWVKKCACAIFYAFCKSGWWSCSWWWRGCGHIAATKESDFLLWPQDDTMSQDCGHF